MVAHHHWVRQIEEIIRSRHYTWIAEGLGGNEVPEAVRQLLVNTMRLAHHAGLDWNDMYAAARQQFECEERAEAALQTVSVADATPED